MTFVSSEFIVVPVSERPSPLEFFLKSGLELMHELLGLTVIDISSKIGWGVQHDCP